MSQDWKIQNSLEDQHELNSFEERIARFEALCKDTPLDLFEAFGGRLGRHAPPSDGSDSISSEPEPLEGAKTVQRGRDR